ncbi:hypothetical protein SprV_0200725900 [Sparganum proliferum]
MTKTIPGADGWTDHRLVISKMRIRLQPRRRPQAHYLHFSNELAQRLVSLPAVGAAAAEENASVDNRWCQLLDTVQLTALSVLGCALRQHQDRFDDNNVVISNLLAEKNRLHKAYVTRPTDDNRAAFYHSRRLVQQRCARFRMLGRLARPRRSKVMWIATNGIISSPQSRLSTVRQPKQLLLFSTPTAIPY